MNFSLTPQLDIFVRERVLSCDYNNASEVVREAIRLFKRIEEEHAFKLEQLRLADPASRDLQAIAEYTQSEWGAKQKIIHLNLIKQSFNTLSRSGNIGKQRNEITAGLYSYGVKKICCFL